MKTLLGTYELLNRQSRNYEQAELFEGIDAKNLLDFERDWKPAFDQAANANEDVSTAERIAADAEDAHWDWKRLAEVYQNPLLFQMYAVECKGKTQGLMLVHKGGKFSRHKDHKGSDLIYIDRLATAPWNRPVMVKHPVYKGIGQLLFATAVNLSLEEELGGRIGLHSLPGAETFYRDVMKLTDFGPDREYHGLCYFEMAHGHAAVFLSGKTK